MQIAHDEAVYDVLVREQSTLAWVLGRPHEGIGRHGEEDLDESSRKGKSKRRGA